MQNILTKIKAAQIRGRGGADFPAYLKWQRVAQAKSNQKFVICNASEGEPDSQKDLYILENYLNLVFLGLKTAANFLEAQNIYFNINNNYYFKIKNNLDNLINKYSSRAKSRDINYNFKIFVEKPSYIGGERNALMSAIEGKRTEPILRLPSPSINGMWGHPTLVHNVETLYDIGRVETNQYQPTRFCTIAGQAKNPGVFNINNNLNIKQILDQTQNYPDFNFFVQIGGGMSGVVYNSDQLADKKLSGSGSVTIYNSKTTPKEFLTKIFKFYQSESCGKCTPCREGTHQLYQLILNNNIINYPKILDIIFTLKNTSFCGLGESLAQPVESYLQNILLNKNAK